MGMFTYVQYTYSFFFPLSHHLAHLSNKILSISNKLQLIKPKYSLGTHLSRPYFKTVTQSFDCLSSVLE